MTGGSVLLVVPTLGERLDYLEQTLASIAAQEHAGLSVLVVGPGTGDGARGLAERFGHRYVDETGRSLSAAIVQGWAETEALRADVLAWLGDDDLLAPGAVARATAALAEHPDAPMVYGRCRYIDADGTEIFTARPGRIAVWFSRFGQDVIPQPGSFQRASAVRAVGGVDAGLRYAMDLDLFLRLRREGRFVYLPHTQAAFRLHPTSLTMSNAEPGVEAAMVRERYLGPVGRALLPVSRPVFRVAAKVWAALQWRHLV